jgi:hypothetical protein
VTHPFGGGEKFHMKMWSDIIETEMNANLVETSPLTDFGKCIKRDKLIVNNAVACKHYTVHSRFVKLAP